MKDLLRIAISGGAGQIAYSLLFRLASGEVFGSDQPLEFRILELPESMQALNGVKMELEDCAYPLLKKIIIDSNPINLFKEIDYALLVGAKPRGPGMERADLLKENGKIFIEQGKALDQVASKNVKVLVVGNPCNTNALITMKHASSIPRKNFFAMTRLDQNRAISQLALKSNRDVKEISNMIIWGNHSSTQVPDYFHAKIGGQFAMEIIEDKNWFESEFVPSVQKRGAAIIAARGKSSAASAANAIIDTIKSMINPTQNNECYSIALCSDDNPYGIERDLIYSFPCKTNSKGEIEIIKDLEINDFLFEKLKFSEKELLEEKELASK